MSISAVLIVKNEAHHLRECLETLTWADEIVVLQKGRVIERGRHAELLAAGGWYAAQWRYQQLEASLRAG